MLRRITLSAILGGLILTASCAAEAPKEEEAPVTDAAPAKVEGPYYELTKDEVTSNPDWTSMNVTLKGAKIGDKTTAVEKAFGEAVKNDSIGGMFYRTIYEKSRFAIYTFQMSGELQKIEIYSHMADQIKDPKFKKLLSGGSLDYMREAFGMEEMAEMNADTTAMEYFYDAKGFRFAKYEMGGNKVNALIFSKMKK
jgi:hypothetical protein